jgi:hypothetical protein
MSHKSTFNKGYAAIVSNNEVIQHPDVDQRQGSTEAARDRFIGGAWFSDSRGVLGCISACNRPFWLWV